MNAQLPTVPSQLVIGFINGSAVRVLEIDGCALSLESEEPTVGPLDLLLAVFNYKEYSFDRFEFRQCDVLDSRQDGFSYIYRIQLRFNDGPVEKAFGDRIEEIATMLDFARNRTLEDPEELLSRMDSFANYLPVYPRKLETRFHQTVAEQLRNWFDLRLVPPEDEAFVDLSGSLEMAFCLSRISLVELFCRADSLRGAIDEALAQYGLDSHGLFRKPVDRLYIGNEFCSHLFPSPEQLSCLLDKAAQEGLSITICTSFVTQDQLARHTELLDRLHRWGLERDRVLEVVCNDWGLFHYIHEHQLQLTPVLGRLLNKRKKDPRQQWQFGRSRYSKRLEENSLNQPHFRAFLENFGIRRFEFEAHLTANLIPPGNHSLHFPYFQMNTSHYCPLFAECRYFNRAAQRKVNSCPNYCEEFVFLYPSHLNIIGWGNTLFGFNRQSLGNPLYLQDAIANGIDRLVFSP